MGVDTSAGAALLGGDVSLPAIREAAALIAPYVVRTPTLPVVRLSERLGLPVVAKFEMLQHTGAFKARGAFHKMLRLSPAERAAGVVAVSGGNHGLAVAYAARELGLDATVIMPSTTAPSSVTQARTDGARVVVTDTIGQAFAQALAEVDTGKVMIHPFDDPAVIAGVAVALKSLKPEIRVWGVETVGADAMTRSLAAGEPVTLDAITSIATTLGAPTVSPQTLAAVQGLVNEVVLVSDADAVRGIELLSEVSKVITEPAAACTWPAALAIRDRLPGDAQVALILCGGNASLDAIAGWRATLT